MFRKTQYVAASAVVLLALLLLNLSSTASSRLKLGLRSFFLPLFGLAGALPPLADRGSWWFVPRRAMVAEIERLQKENQQLKLDGLTQSETLAENGRLRKSVDWAVRQPSRDLLRFARVVGYEPNPWWRTCQIDLGSRDGVRLDHPVLTSDGLVGRISLVGYSHSQVSLVGDPACGISVIVGETRDLGVIQGSLGVSILAPGVVQMMYLPNSARLKPEQLIYTSGLGSVFPKGIVVGKILETKVESGLYTSAKIQLSANIERLEEVWVWLNH